MAHEQVDKFRGLTPNGGWVYGNLTVLKKSIHPAPGSYISNEYGAPFAYIVRPETVGQFIRLYDKDGTEIYDGDRVTKFEMITPDDDSTVIYRNGAFGYINKCIGFISFAQNQHFNWFNNKSNRIKVVGNVHEASELTKVNGT